MNFCLLLPFVVQIKHLILQKELLVENCLLISPYTQHYWKCLQCNGYCCRKCTWWPKFKPAWGCLHFTWHYYPLERYEYNYSSSTYRKIVGQTGLFKLGWLGVASCLCVGCVCVYIYIYIYIHTHSIIFLSKDWLLVWLVVVYFTCPDISFYIIVKYPVFIACFKTRKFRSSRPN